MLGPSGEASHHEGTTYRKPGADKNAYKITAFSSNCQTFLQLFSHYFSRALHTLCLTLLDCIEIACYLFVVDSVILEVSG